MTVLNTQEGKVVCPVVKLLGIKLWTRHSWTEVGSYVYPFAYGEGYMALRCTTCGAVKDEQFAGGP